MTINVLLLYSKYCFYYIYQILCTMMPLNLFKHNPVILKHCDAFFPILTHIGDTKLFPWKYRAE